MSQDFESADDKTLRLRAVLQSVPAGMPGSSDEPASATIPTATDSADHAITTVAAHAEIPVKDLDADELPPPPLADATGMDDGTSVPLSSETASAPPSFQGADIAARDVTPIEAKADLAASAGTVDVELRVVVTQHHAGTSAADHGGGTDQLVIVEHLHWQSGQSDTLQAPSNHGLSFVTPATPAFTTVSAEQIVFSAQPAHHDGAPAAAATETSTAAVSSVSVAMSTAELANTSLDSATTSAAHGATAAQLRQALGESAQNASGAGIKIGVLSDSFNDLGGATSDEVSGALPSSVQVLKDMTSGGTDEGRAMMQIIHEIAPAAGLAFYTAFNSEQDFANGILALAAAGCKVICDDVSYFDEPFFQNGIIAQAIKTVEAQGVTYITSAGNDGSAAYQAAWSPMSGSFDGVNLTNAESFGGSIAQTITVTASQSDPLPLLLEWDQAYGHATSNLEILVFHNGTLVGTATNSSSGEPTNPWIDYEFTASGTYQIAVENLSGPNPGLIKEIAAGDGLSVTISGANAGTVYGHAMTPGVITAGAVNAASTPAFGVNPATSESFSSSGAGSELLFADNGTRLSSPQALSPVAVSGIDNIATTLAGGLGDFFGTSAASASLAGVAALILAANPSLTPAQIEQIMEQTALPMSNAAVSGAGLVQVDAAIAAAHAYASVTIEAFGSISLLQSGPNYLVEPVSGGTGTIIKFGGAPVLVGQLGGWIPVGAEATASGYEVAWEIPSTNQYTAWNIDQNGNYVSNAIGAVSGNSVALEALEPGFHQDLNADGVIGIPATAVEAAGTTSLVESGANYFLNPVGGGTGPSVKYGGAAVVVGQLGGWIAIGAEAITGGYEIAWQIPGANEFTVWNTDSNGNYISSAMGAVPASSSALQALETSFHQDLNGDGVIGIPTVVVEAAGTTSLVQVGSNYFLNPVGGGTGPELKFGGAVVDVTQIGGWMAIGTEPIAGGGYEVALKMQGQDLYTVWNTDSSGNYVGNATAAVSGSNIALESLETSFHQDLNGDGVIGIATTIIESNGATSLVQVANTYFLNPVGGGTGPTLNFGETAVAAGGLGGWTPIAVETNGGGYEVAFKMQGQDLYTVWNTDSRGNYIGNATNAVSGSNAALEALETSFHQDLNGDGTIGIPASSGVVSTLTMATSAADGHMIILGAEDDGSASAARQFLGSSTPDSFHFSNGHGETSVNDAANPVTPAGQQSGAANAAASIAHDAFVFAANPGGFASFHPSTDNSAFVAQETFFATIHDAANGHAVVSDAVHDVLTITHVTAAQMFAHHADFHLV